MSKHKDRLQYGPYRNGTAGRGLFQVRRNRITSPSSYSYHAEERDGNEKPELQPPSITVYVKEDPNCTTVVIKSLDNFMTPRELCEQFGAAVVQDYAEGENWMHQCEIRDDYPGECLNCNLFVPIIRVCVVDTIYSYREGTELTKKEYKDMIQQMATAHKALGKIIVKYQTLPTEKINL